jgi:hypothetical protein
MCASWRWISTGADDPYWLYRDSPSHPIEEILKVLEEFRKAAQARWLLELESITSGGGPASSRSSGVQGFIASQSTWSLAKPDIAQADPHVGVH